LIGLSPDTTPPATCLGYGRRLELDALHVHLYRIVDAPGYQVGEGDQQADHDDLDDDERHRTPVDLRRGDRSDGFLGQAVDVLAVRRHAAQVEQGEAEGRVHEGGLHVDRHQHAEPDQVDAQLVRHRAEQRNDDEGQLEEVEEEREEEDQQVDHDQEAELAAGQAGQQVFDPEVEPSTAWKVRLNTVAPSRMKMTKQDSFMVASIACFIRLRLRRRRETAIDQRAYRAHGTAFGGRRDAEENCTKHEENQRQRRYQDEGDAFGHARKQAHLGDFIDHRQREGDADADAHGNHDQFVGRRVRRPRLGKSNERRRRRRSTSASTDLQAGAAVIFADGACFERQRRNVGSGLNRLTMKT
jgi:hypothetical protein